MIRERLPRPIRRAGRWAKQQINPRGVILMYHRIAEERFDPWNLCVTPDHFAEQLDVLQSTNVRVMHLHELAASLASGKIPKRSVVITFDDGYLDNLENARPVLDRHGIPATVFVASGYVGSEGEFWWDAMERILLMPGKLPEKLEVEIAGERRSWDLNGDATWTEADAERYREWKPYTQAQTARQRLYQELRKVVLRDGPAERARIIAELLTWAGIPSTARPERRILDDDGLRRLAADDLIDIGGHSITHPELANLSVPEQDHELRTSKDRLEQILGREVTALAYPHGSCSADTKRLAEAAGYGFACGTQRRPVQRGTDLYELPRVGVRNVPGREFKAMLAEFLPI